MDTGRQTIAHPERKEGIAFAIIAGLIVLTAVAVVWRAGGHFLERWAELSGAS